jgi:bifunctional non-homologous end joining protein LigD
MPPIPMLASASSAWPAGAGWVLEPKWDGFRLLVSITDGGRIRAWSRHGTSLGARLGELLDPFTDAPRGSVFDAELVALSRRDGHVIQDFTTVCRAVLQGYTIAAQQLQLIAFDLLELAGDDLRSLPLTQRTSRLQEVFPVGDRLRLVQSMPATRQTHDHLVQLGFEGSVLKRPGSTYRAGRQRTWRKLKASHRVTAKLKTLRSGRDGNTYAICNVDGRRVAVLGSPRLQHLIGSKLELAYSRIDADGSLREVRISSVTPLAPHAHTDTATR